MLAPAPARARPLFDPLQMFFGALIGAAGVLIGVANGHGISCGGSRDGGPLLLPFAYYTPLLALSGAIPLLFFIPRTTIEGHELTERRMFSTFWSKICVFGAAGLVLLGISSAFLLFATVPERIRWNGMFTSWLLACGCILAADFLFAMHIIPKRYA